MAIGLAASTPADAQVAQDVFPAVVFLSGHQGPETTKIDGRTVEVWIRRREQAQPTQLFRESTGTGFIVLRGTDFFLVTAAHVASKIPNDPVVIVLRGESEPATFELAALARARKVEWVFHPHADVAAIPLSPPQAFSTSIKAVQYEQLATPLSAPQLDTTLTTVGFPLKLGVADRFSPIVKSAKPASGLFDYPRFDNETETTFFILDDPSVAGFSGAPVFRLPLVGGPSVKMSQGPFECVGLVHGNFNDPTGGKFAAIVPAAFIAETVHAAAEH